jgi:hypothetical protein
MSKIARLLAVLNMGNAGNYQRLRDGYGWSDQDMLAIRDSLSKEDMEFVQGIWDFIEGYWTEVAALEKRLTGVAPPKIARQAIKTRHGTYAGGYLPAMYDAEQGSQAYQDSQATAASDQMRGARGRAVAQASFTKKRAERVTDRQIRLDFGVIFEHVSDVAHRLAWQEWLIDTGRILADKRVAGAIMQGYGLAVYQTLTAWHRDIAAGDAGVERNMEWLNQFRSNAAIAGLGWSVSTALLQPLGITQSIALVGPKWISIGLKKWMIGSDGMVGASRWIQSVSPAMTNRWNVAGTDMQREIREVNARLTEGTALDPVKDTFFLLLVKAQQLVDIPTWLGSYEQEMAASGDESKAIAKANRMVFESQGSGQIQDLSEVQRGGAALKAWTLFYSFFNTTLNIHTQLYRSTDFKSPAQVAAFAGNMILLHFIPAQYSSYLWDYLTGDEDDETHWFRKLAENQASWMLGMWIGFREMSSFASGYYDWKGPAGTRIFSSLGAMLKQIEQGEVDKAAIKASVNLLGVAKGLPAVQINRAIEGSRQLYEGETNNPARILIPKKEKR